MLEKNKNLITVVSLLILLPVISWIMRKQSERKAREIKKEYRFIQLDDSLNATILRANSEPSLRGTAALLTLKNGEKIILSPGYRSVSSVDSFELNAISGAYLYKEKGNDTFYLTDYRHKYTYVLDP